MPQGVQITFGGDSSDAQRALGGFERTLAAMTKQAEQAARTMAIMETRLKEVGKDQEPPKRLNIFAEALEGVSNRLTALVGGGALLAAFTKGMQEASAATDEAAQKLRELESALQLAARVGAAGRETRAQIEAKGREIAIGEGLSPAEGIRIAALASQEGFFGEAAVFARAQSRLGVPGAQAIDVAGKLSESFGKFSAQDFFGSVINASARLGASPEEVVNNLETLGPQAARAGFGLEETIALTTGIGERTGKKQAVGAARALFDRLAGGLETERPASAADIGAALAAGKSAPRTVKDRLRFAPGLGGVDQLLRRPELADLVAQDSNLALALETLPGVRGELPNIIGQRAEFPEAASPALEAVRGSQAARVLDMMNL